MSDAEHTPDSTLHGDCTHPGGHRWRNDDDACTYCGQDYHALAVWIPGHAERVAQQEMRERALAINAALGSV